jgi:flagellar motor switch/type III secretory pathway protein FliN
VAAELVVALPATAPPPEPRSLAALCATRGARLPSVRVGLALARGQVAAWSAVRLRDVIVVGPAAAALVIGRGVIAVTLDRRGARVTVLAPYQRAVMSSDDLAHDLTIPLAIVAGDVSLSARALLELAPGQVLALGRAVGTAVELRSGERCLARGELVTVDGELGVRVTELVDPAPAVVATRG